MTHHGCGGVLRRVPLLGPCAPHPLTAFLPALTDGHGDRGPCWSRNRAINSTTIAWEPPPRTCRHQHQSFTNSLPAEPPPRHASHLERKCGAAGRWQAMHPRYLLDAALLAFVFNHASVTREECSFNIFCVFSRAAEWQTRPHEAITQARETRKTRRRKEVWGSNYGRRRNR